MTLLGARSSARRLSFHHRRRSETLNQRIHEQTQCLGHASKPRPHAVIGYRACFVSTLLFLAVWITPAAGQTSGPSDPSCCDWGESSQAAVAVLEGQVCWLTCPLFSHSSVYKLSHAHSAGHNLVWYRLPEDQDLEQPISYSSRLTKDRERLWLQPAVAADSGLYTCMLCNKSSCSKIAMRLKVLRPDQVARGAACEPPVVVRDIPVIIPLQEGEVLDCPDRQDAAKMADGELNVTWLHVTPNRQVCAPCPFWNSDREQKGPGLEVHVMLDSYQGLYYCTVQYQRRGVPVRFTRRINVTAVYPSSVPKFPSILHPTQDQVFTVRQDSEARLACAGLFPYLESGWEIWWTVDGKTLDKVPDQHRFSNETRLLKYDYGDRTVQEVLLIHQVRSEDLSREFNCSVRNERGFQTRRAQLEEEGSLPALELGCGLGVTLVLMLLLFILYHVFWLELLLVYRAWFGTDETHTDEKLYDVYISYVRNGEEEQFVLSTLRSVLENELGYSVCIFDRDSLPGGTITDETLSFVARSRRLLVVVSPGYASRDAQALLELKAGIDGMALGGHLRVILIQYKPVHRRGWVKELRRARMALVLVQWKGDKSRELGSRFWKRLRVELPMKRRSREEEEGRGSREAGLMRLHSSNSTNSQTGLISHTAKDPQSVRNYC